MEVKLKLRVLNSKLRKTFGTLLASAVLLMEMSPLADAKASNVNSQTFKTANDSTEARYVSVDGVKINKILTWLLTQKRKIELGLQRLLRPLLN